MVNIRAASPLDANAWKHTGNPISSVKAHTRNSDGNDGRILQEEEPFIDT